MSEALRNLSSIEYGASPKEIRANDFTPIGIYGTGGFVGYSEKALFRGPLIVVARKGTLDNPIFIEGECWVIDTAFAVLPQNGVDGKWLYYQLANFDLKKLNESTGVPSISRDYLYRVCFEKPSFTEQRKIARILTTVDAVIEKTEAAIDKYKAIKNGMMADLFTRGIDSATGKLRPRYEDAPELYKETELGWVPKEWDVELLDSISARGSGHTPSKDHPEYWNGGIKWVSLADTNKLDQLYISETDKEISEVGIANSSAVLHDKGTVILSRDAGIGKSAILAQRMAVSQHFMAWKCSKRLDNYYLYYWLQYSKPMFENIAIGSTIKTIGLSFFKKLALSAPQIVEQEITAKSLLAIDQILFKLQTELKKQQNLKQGLMADLLTGRVRVQVAEEAAAEMAEVSNG